MTGQLILNDGRWARVGMGLVAVALVANLPLPSYLGTSILPPASAPTVSSVAHPTAPIGFSEDLPPGLEAAISATLGEAYLITPGVGGALEARNPGQDLEVRFSAGGFGVRPIEGNWSFDLSVARFGRQDQLFSVATTHPLALGARVEYQRVAFTEWYENRPDGIEQGFTLTSPPSGGGLVVLELRRTEALSAELVADGRSVIFSDLEGRVVLRYQDLVVYDASGQELSGRLELGLGTISLLVDDRGAEYPITIDPLVVTEQAHLFASDGALLDEFGYSVALAGDTALVGAYVEGSFAGSAYVFVRDGDTWTEQAHLIASDASPNDFFGFSVALDGDTALVGAIGDNNGTGSAYVFVRNGTTWTEQDHLFAPDGAEFGFFLGLSVALDGDTALMYGGGSGHVFVRDGTAWTEQAQLLPGEAGGSMALADDTALVLSGGKVVVFVRNGTVWTEEGQLTASDGVPGDTFGNSMALTGDTALIGTSNDETSAGVSAGSAYVFVRNGTTWTEQAHLFASNGSAFSTFGKSVALADDTALAGADGAQTAYVFVRNGTTWTERARLIASDGAAFDSFGYSVAVDGDIALVGAPFDDTVAEDAGSAYVFRIPSCTVTGTEGNDVLTGTSGDDVICGLGGNDHLNGRGGNDTLLGGNGNDILDGGTGLNTLDGGDGTDTANYSTAARGVTANLATGLASGPSTDALIGLENLIGSNLADRLTGDSGNNLLNGRGGSDRLNGAAGTDTCLNGELTIACEL